MYKIKFLPTGHIFVLPESVVKELKERYPQEYQLLEKNGRKCKDKFNVTSERSDKNSIRVKVIEKG